MKFFYRNRNRNRKETETETNPNKKELAVTHSTNPYAVFIVVVLVLVSAASSFTSHGQLGSHLEGAGVTSALVVSLDPVVDASLPFGTWIRRRGDLLLQFRLLHCSASSSGLRFLNHLVVARRRRLLLHRRQQRHSRRRKLEFHDRAAGRAAARLASWS